MANSNYILGINGGVRPGYQDIAAVLMCDGKIIAAVEEERLNRIKHCSGQLPVLSVKEVLRIAGLNINQIAVLAFHGSTWQPGIEDVLKNHFENYFGFCPSVKRYHHHNCHAASAYYCSGFDEALVITADGSGDGISTQISVGKKGRLVVVHRYERPQSLGIYYSVFTQLCGFTRDADEYKLMGLAAYGNASKFNLDDVLSVSENGYHFDENYIVPISAGQPSPSRHEMLFNKNLLSKLGVKRRVENEIGIEYKHLAAAAQFQLEKALLALVKKYVAETGINKVCLAGGVALNCLANQKIEMLSEVEDLFIQPAANDAGISLGAALLASAESGSISFEKQTHSFFGSKFSQKEVEETLTKCGVKCIVEENLLECAAQSLAANKVIGWFQGKMEFGPRALGNRSILANPSAPDIQQIVNYKIKFREGFRPFGASVLEEDFHEFFEAKCNDAPYMTKVFYVKEKYREQLKGVTHADGTCRVQTVNKNQNTLYYDLISAFKMKAGMGVLLNTSFNLNHEPIVNSPRNALASFFACGLDELFIGNCRIEKK